MTTATASVELANLLREKREDILRIAEKHGASNVRVFGSVIHGEAGPESDIDFLVDTGSHCSSWFPGGLIVDLEDLLGRKIDIAEPVTLHWYIRDTVLKEALPLEQL